MVANGDGLSPSNNYGRARYYLSIQVYYLVIRYFALLLDLVGIG